LLGFEPLHIRLRPTAPLVSIRSAAFKTTPAVRCGAEEAPGAILFAVPARCRWKGRTDAATNTPLLSQFSVSGAAAAAVPGEQKRERKRYLSVQPEHGYMPERSS